MTAIELIDAKDYETALHLQIPKARRRIIIFALQIIWGSRTAVILDKLLEAQKRGVSVSLLYDRYSWLPFSYDKFLPSMPIHRNSQRILAFSAELEAAGGVVSEVGRVWSFNPFARRMHAKVTILDDVIYSFGGVNFTDAHFGFADYMFRVQSAPMADKLADLHEEIVHSAQLPDQEWMLNDSSVVLFDGGTPGKSIIYERACELAAQSAQVIYASQMSPSGKLAKAMEGKSVCYYNRINQASSAGKIGLAIDTWRYGLKNHYKGEQYIHAKFMLFKMKDGSRVLLSGSNNFSWRGVAFGTKEIALQSGDPILWDELAHFLQIKIIGP